MSRNKRYYYLKLKEDYFDQDAILLLESLPQGLVYSNILLKLYLKSLKSEGRLQVEEGIPYTTRMIATITRQREPVVKRALEVYRELGLAQALPDGTLLLPGLENMVGRDSTAGERMRRARRTKGEQTGNVCAPEKEKEKEKETEPETEPETEGERETEDAPAPTLLGQYTNVFLTPEEQAELSRALGDRLEDYVQNLSAYMASTGQQYQNHAATILRWAEADARKAGLPLGDRGYDLPEEECL